MDVQESQSNWQEMRKTLGKPGFCSGEDRNRTTYKFPGKLALRHHARREIRRAPISLFETTRNTIHRDQPAPSLQPDLQGHEFKTDPNLQGHGFPFTGSFTGSHQKPLRIYRVTISIYRVKRTMTLIVFNLEALLVRLRRMGDSVWTQGNAEAVVVDAAVRRAVPEPEPRPTIRGLEVPTAATERAARALFWARRIADCTLWIFFVPVAAPLPNIPMHVVKTPGVWLQKANRMCPVRTVAATPTVLEQQTRFIIK